MRAAESVGLDLDRDQITKMRRYRTWLLEEAAPAGGIGPAEKERLDSRHLGDSLLYASAFPHDVDEIWDLGTGVGLPGIPLAIALPASRFLLVDRSGRRVGLVRRALRVLDLDNCVVMQAEITAMKGETDVVVTRASLPPEEMAGVVQRHLRPGGVAVMGGSWRERPESDSWTVREIPRYALDHTIWLLIMRAA